MLFWKLTFSITKNYVLFNKQHDTWHTGMEYFFYNGFFDQSEAIDNLLNIKNYRLHVGPI